MISIAGLMLSTPEGRAALGAATRRKETGARDRFTRETVLVQVSPTWRAPKFAIFFFGDTTSTWEEELRQGMVYR